METLSRYYLLSWSTKFTMLFRGAETGGNLLRWLWQQRVEDSTIWGCSDSNDACPAALSEQGDKEHENGTKEHENGAYLAVSSC